MNEKSKRYFTGTIRMIYATAGVVLACWILSLWFKLGINSSSSIEGFLYLIVKGKEPVKGELVAFWPPPNKFYKQWFVKYAKGTEGDRVYVENRNIYLNGELIGHAKEKSRSGEPLDPGDSGVIPKNHMFVWTPNEDSYDSRYKDIGWIPYDNVIGRAYRIF